MEDDAAGCGCGKRAGLAISCNILESVVSFIPYLHNQGVSDMTSKIVTSIKIVKI